MFCSRCGNALVAGAAFCTRCGTPTGTGIAQSGRLPRPGLVTVLAVLQFVGAALTLAVAVGFAIGAITEDTDVVSTVMVGLFAVISALQVTCGIGLLKLRPYGRIIQLGFAFVGLLGIPMGTIISICIIVYMFNPGIKALFAGRPPNELSEPELAAIAEVSRSSAAATVLVVVVVGIVAFVMLGIVAAIAIPALLRARMAGNEAMAIGSLRTINSAQASYSAAAGKGGFATRLSTLGTACPGYPVAFIGPELAEDPSTKSGFTISMERLGVPTGDTDCNGVPTETDYYATAAPTTPGTTGQRAFSTSSMGTIYFDHNGRPPSPAAVLSGTARPVN